MIEPGTPAPDFTLPDENGTEVSLADLAGSRVLLVFYPQDFSPTCTDQLNVYEEVRGEIEAAGVRMFGVSVDSSWAHKAFQRQLGISIPLLSDFHPKGEVARRFGLWVEDYGVSARALVLIGPDGVVEWAYRSPPLEVPGANLIFDALERSHAA